MKLIIFILISLFISQKRCWWVLFVEGQAHPAAIWWLMICFTLSFKSMLIFAILAKFRILVILAYFILVGLGYYGEMGNGDVQINANILWNLNWYSNPCNLRKENDEHSVPKNNITNDSDDILCKNITHSNCQRESFQTLEEFRIVQLVPDKIIFLIWMIMITCWGSW